jgi:hypothetical protein
VKTPTITGKAEAGAKVEVTVNGKTYTTTADKDGNYSVPVTDSLSDGTYTPSIKVTDAAGNSSTAAGTAFTVDAAAMSPATATQTFNTTANVPRSGQTTSFIADVYHEGTQLPRFQGQNGSSGSGWTPIDCGTSTSVSLLQAGNYRIRALYTFTLNSSNSNWMALEVIPGQHDDVSTTGCLTLVPLPPAAWAGIGGLGVVGGLSYMRNRKLKKCNVAGEANA